MEFLAYGVNAFTPLIVVVAIGGLVIGIVLGALPGLSSTFSLAVMLPVSISMDPVDGLVFRRRRLDGVSSMASSAPASTSQRRTDDAIPGSTFNDTTYPVCSFIG